MCLPFNMIMIIIIITGNILIKYNMLVNVVNYTIHKLILMSLWQQCSTLYIICLLLQMCLILIEIIMNLIGKV